MRIAFTTLGCKVNQYETENLAELFSRDGFEVVEPQDAADVYVVNSCTVTASGDKKTRQLLRRLKKLDHSMIYVLIAGSYTPIILKFMPAPRSYVFLGVIWLIALTGIAIKLLWIDAPRLIGTALYLALGWAIAFDFGVVLSMPAPAIALLAAGGLSYTVGGVIYIAKKPNLGKMIGFHELFHLFVIVGSVCHYLMVFLYVL